MMKKALVTTLLLLLALCAGCGQKDANAPAEKGDGAQKGLKVVTTLFPNYDFARQVAGEHADVSLIVPPGADAHSFELTPEALKTIQSADVFIYTGDDMEPWVAGIRADIEKKGKPIIVNASQGIDLKKSVNGEGDAHQHEGHDHDGEAHKHDAHEHEHDGDAHKEAADKHEGDAHKEEAHKHEGEHSHQHVYDPHVWTSLPRAEKMIATITDALVKADYEKNAKAYTEKWHALDDKYKKMTQSAKRKTIVVADEFAFRYFADDYQLHVVAMVDSANEKAEPGAKRIAELVNFVKQEKIPVVYHTELSEPKMAKLVAQETGAKTMLLDAGHTVSAEDMKKGVTFLEIMEKNYDALEKGLNG